MDVTQMREELKKKYSESFVAKMADDQVIAVYRRLQSQKKI